MKKSLTKGLSLVLIMLLSFSGCSLFGSDENADLSDSARYIQPYIGLILENSFNLEETRLTPDQVVEMYFEGVEKGTLSVPAKELEESMAGHLGLDKKELQTSTYYSSKEKKYTIPSEVEQVVVEHLEILEETKDENGVTLLFSYSGYVSSAPEVPLNITYRWTISEKSNNFILKSGERVSVSVQ